jgi:hypothetical protein
MALMECALQRFFARPLLHDLLWLGIVLWPTGRMLLG